MRPLNHWLDELLATSGRAGSRRGGCEPGTPLMDEFPIGYSRCGAPDSSEAARYPGGNGSMSGSDKEDAHGAFTDGSIHPVMTGADSASAEAPVAVPFVSSGVSRAERLAAIRAQIEAGVYDTPERLEAAVDKLARVLSREL